jgi:hypothetical protein
MLDFKEIQQKYQGKLWKQENTNKRIFLKELIYYEGSKNFKIVYRSELNTTEYLNDISEETLFDFLLNLKDPYKVIKPESVKKISMETKNNDMEIPAENKINNLEDLSKSIYKIINDVVEDRIKIEKAVAISKLAQVILNIEKQRFLFSEKNVNNG